ncbi:MAG: hypothetical protein Q8R79_01435 [Legionellaceae bacterium]|nr:hypothetical protein [Legionellaceae bacterium]
MLHPTTFFGSTPDFKRLIETYYQEVFPGLMLAPSMINQLSWLQNNSVFTSQANVSAPTTSINSEIKRVLSRHYCVTLLIEGTENAYQRFTVAQAGEHTLSRESFSTLSQFISRLSPIAQRCLFASCYITKSDEAIRVLHQQNISLPSDSEYFISDLVKNHAGILPICAGASPEVLALLPYAFLKGAHARHILDMEGGYNMLSSIQQAIETQTFSLEQLNLWFARWIINIAGLNGHANPRGSITLTEPVAQCIFALQKEIQTQFWKDPKHRVLDRYLSFRCEQLGVSHPYLARLGALMRRYTRKDGAEIQVWFDSLPIETQGIYLQNFTVCLCYTSVTPTYQPTVLENLLALPKQPCSIAEALTIFTELESQATSLYERAREDRLLSPNTPLSFIELAVQPNLSVIVEYYRQNNTLPHITINPTGKLSTAENTVPVMQPVSIQPSV